MRDQGVGWVVSLSGPASHRAGLVGVRLPVPQWHTAAARCSVPGLLPPLASALSPSKPNLPQALEASGMAALAGEARHKLAQLQGDAPEETFDAEYEPHASEEEQEEEEEEEWAPRRRR